MRYKYFMKLYIDKKCKICENFGKIINEKNSMIEIKDYREKDSESILFEDGSKIYYEFNAINRALSCAGKKNIILNIILKLPNRIQKILYKILSRNRKIISLFFLRNQTKT